MQHYVPQFLLRGFAREAGQLHVYDKQTDRVFRAAPSNVAAESGFYDLDAGSVLLTMEPGFGDLESRAALIVDALRSGKTIAQITDKERFTLAEFMTAQYLRTRQFRERIADMNRQTGEWMRSRGLDPSKVRNHEHFEDAEAVKAFSMGFLNKAINELAPYVYEKDWVLVKTDTAHPLLIGDNPVALYNKQTFGFYGNIGFAVPGIELSMPISEATLLWVTCRTIGDSFRQTQREIDDLNRMTPNDPEVEYLATKLRPALDGFIAGAPIVVQPETVTHYNALQVRYAERWVFSADGNFDLVRQMIEDDPKYRIGPRGQVG